MEEGEVKEALEPRNGKMSDEEWDLLMYKYGLRFRTASQLDCIDGSLRGFIFKMMDHVYERGKSGDQSRNQL